jgi:hypothetical protein
MEVFFHTSEPLFEIKNLFYQTNNSLFILYKNLEYEIISTVKNSQFKKSYTEHPNAIFYPEKIDTLIDYVNLNSSSIKAVLCPSSFALHLNNFTSNIENKILFYGLTNDLYMHMPYNQKEYYSKVFISNPNLELRNKCLNSTENLHFSKIGQFCDYDILSNHKKYFLQVYSKNNYRPKKLQKLAVYNNLLWLNNYGQNVPSNSLKILNLIRNTPSSKIGISIIDRLDFTREDCIEILQKHKCCAFLAMDGKYTNSFTETTLISSYAPVLKITSDPSISSCADSMYHASEDIDDIKRQFNFLKRDMQTNNFKKMQKSFRYMQNLLKIHENCNVLAVEALSNVVGKDIDELILNNNIDYLEGKDLYQFVRNFNNW